jgi:hypothetical protein
MLRLGQIRIDFESHLFYVCSLSGVGGMQTMVSLADRRIVAAPLMRQANWRGRSGKFYSLTPERLDSFSLSIDGLHMLARGTLPLWVGSAEDVINDAQSRARFRLALAAADRAFFVGAGEDDLSRMTLVWDLEGAEPVTGLSAA